eukprot:9168-Heterococcus_DN1.PRE.1
MAMHKLDALSCSMTAVVAQTAVAVAAHIAQQCHHELGLSVDRWQLLRDTSGEQYRCLNMMRHQSKATWTGHMYTVDTITASTVLASQYIC